MRSSLAVILSLLSIACYAQEWTTYHVDSVLTLSLPDNYEEKDTLEQRIIIAYVEDGLIMATVLKNEGDLAFNVSNEKELLEGYKGFQRGYMNSTSGQLIKQEIIERQGLKFSRFSCKAMMDGETQIRHCICIFLKGKVYSINFWESEFMTNEVTEVREKLFASITLPAGLTIEDQFNVTVEGSLAYKAGYLVGYVGVLILFLGAIVAGIAWLVKRNQKKHSPEFFE